MVNLTLRKRTIEWLLKEEGFRSKPYKCTEGVLTFGHGLTYITEEESLNIVKKRVEEIISKLPAVLGDTALDDFRKAILVDMCFQLGIKGVCSFKGMLAALAKGDYETAAQEMLNSKWHVQTPVRCEKLAERMRKGC